VNDKDKEALARFTRFINYVHEKREKQEAENVDQELVADDVNEVFEETHRWK